MVIHMLIINDLSLRYKTRQAVYPVIDRLSFQLEAGRALAILGPSGCGKSTLIHALSGSLPIAGGTAEFITEDGRLPLSAKRHRIGLIPQNCGLLPWKTVRENCLLPLKLRREYRSEKHSTDLHQLCEALNISSLLEKYPRQLSGGELQRAAIARAFLQQPDLLLMDEPFSALDEIIREEARALFLSLWKQQRPTTLLVTHSIEEALYLGTDLLVMEAQGGGIRYQSLNPYFGISNPQDADYFAARQQLRSRLTANEKEPEGSEGHN